jgi:hypothetical protein
MTDIVKRLRLIESGHWTGLGRAWLQMSGREAADEIELLRKALVEIADMCPATADITLAHDMADRADRAIRGDTHD